MQELHICICTFKRINLLAHCLKSISAIAPPQSVNITVMIIDNDEGLSAKAVVDDLQNSFPFVLSYVCEAKRGIPCARNRAIEEALHQSSDYIVFLDDDEWVEKNWLLELFGYCQQKGGNVVVHGRVIPELPPGVAKEIAGLFAEKVRLTGQRLGTCATDNVIVPARVYRELGIRFDETNPLAGGTDTKYFVEAAAKGVEIYQCVEAVVHEAIPMSRANLKWLAKRKFRAGITDAWKKKKEGRSSYSIGLSSCFRILLDLIKAIVLQLFFRKMKRNYYILKVCKAAGLLAGSALDLRVDSYKSVDG